MVSQYWLPVDQVPFQLRVLHAHNLLIEELQVFVGHLMQVEVEPVAKHDLQLLSPNVPAAMHNHPLVSIDILRFLTKFVFIACKDLWKFCMHGVIHVPIVLLYFLLLFDLSLLLDLLHNLFKIRPRTELPGHGSHPSDVSRYH